ncbi:hypothetical protein CFD26_104364 [Aspergillus turcosus]|uniref:SET domain-containing protein n=1 Tax=Aspergillus turcosus TaxID=1245748 RepID=A0A421D355_9EURO|nr:hypothetical protein CFD26_104364 [Aspergillus turcosus]
MDTHNVSESTEYLQYLHRQKQTLQNAQSHKGQRPRPTKTRDEIIMQFMLRRMMASKVPVDFNAIRSSFVPPAYAPCVTPLSDLKKVMIRDLTLETHHRGSYIILRAVTPPDTMTAIMVIVEDEEENALMLQLYNQEEELSEKGCLTEGTVFVPEHDTLIPSSWRRRLMGNDASANYWKMKGNECFNKANYHVAIDCYCKALDTSPTIEEALTIRLNRALAFLKTHQFDTALRDLEMASTGSKPSEKALFRKAQALYSLQKFRESCDTHEALAKEYPNNAAAKSEFNRAIARLVEQKSGKYQFKRLQLEANNRRPPVLDHATYVGPVSVRSTESRGRGLFTTKPVKAGDLLFCEKAFAYAFHDAEDSRKGLVLLINAQTDSMTVGTQAELIALIVQKLYKNPSLMPAFTDLYHGSYKPVDVSEVDETPVVDTFLVERIVALNGFGCPLSSRESHIRAMKGEAQLDNAREKFHSCGVWSLASYINYSCYSNARRSFIGDMMVVRATQDLAANTEITFWYQSPLNNDSEEKQMDLRHWGFKCDCMICQDIQTTENSVLTTRKELRAGLRKEFQGRKRPNTTKIEATFSMLEETYRQPASEVPRLSLWSPYLTLAMVYATHHQPQKAIEFALKTLESLGYVVEGGHLPHASGTPLLVKKWGLMTDGLVGCWMSLSSAYRQIAPDLVAQAEGYARITYRICVGEDETFDEAYTQLSERRDGLVV